MPRLSLTVSAVFWAGAAGEAMAAATSTRAINTCDSQPEKTKRLVLGGGRRHLAPGSYRGLHDWLWFVLFVRDVCSKKLRTDARGLMTSIGGSVTFIHRGSETPRTADPLPPLRGYANLISQRSCPKTAAMTKTTIGRRGLRSTTQTRVPTRRPVTIQPSMSGVPGL